MHGEPHSNLHHDGDGMIPNSDGYVPPSFSRLPPPLGDIAKKQLDVQSRHVVERVGGEPVGL